ncbi:MAG: NfeD family protein [Candidatus Acidiferrales bacterium]
MRARSIQAGWWVAAATMVCGVVLAGFPAVAQETASPPTGTSRVLELRIDDVILPLTAEFVRDAFGEARSQNAELILITMNTPGGLDSAMRDIIQQILNSPIPVAVYVSPSGSRAASAGFYILLAADVAAMAPGTNTGAASPIMVVGGTPVTIDETLRKKIINDASAYIRSIAEKRGRNADDAELAVTEGSAWTENEALKRNLIDLVADTPDGLLKELNGREVRRFDGKAEKLDLENPVRVAWQMTGRQKFLAQISRPDVLFILLVLAVLGIFIEFSHPGLILPGAIGGLSLILFLVAIQTIPVNALGILLILTGVALFVLEAKFTSYGLLGLGGVVSILVGAMILVESPLTGFSVSPGMALGITLPMAAITIFLMRLVMRSFRWKSAMGNEQMLGATGEVTKAIHPAGSAYEGSSGMVFVQGELWRAEADQEIPKGAPVRVTRVNGLTVRVEVIPGPPSLRREDVP